MTFNLLERFYPEIRAGGFTRVDGTIEFYNRVNALLRPEMTIVDFGAGRGAGHVDDEVEYRRRLRSLKGKCTRVIGIDLDATVMDNPGLDEANVVEPGQPLPLMDHSVDLIVSDHTFEHITNPGFVSSELDRILKPGGWLLARTPNRWGYAGIGANLVPNRRHALWLKRLQTGCNEKDVFPTIYRLNTRRALRRYFPAARFHHYTYGYTPEPAYFGNSRLLWGMSKFLFRLTPESMAPVWMVVLKKRQLHG